MAERRADVKAGRAERWVPECLGLGQTLEEPVLSPGQVRSR